ncbi:hypothetical protein F4821DRAFT_234475 [Hypoxylon rubiginosum]|uniref:Uncharacterized protein n=1 Tax=Hypoxylon rubiginosum TaxID=110542 RepID=A0ACC0D640_9PEZI|nr:hypothetical protein F4821DRAFT_234475 [Hypoxylon rubiginosum]
MQRNPTSWNSQGGHEKTTDEHQSKTRITDAVSLYSVGRVEPPRILLLFVSIFSLFLAILAHGYTAPFQRCDWTPGAIGHAVGLSFLGSPPIGCTVRVGIGIACAEERCITELLR